eukprot:TRINITY_DN59749_c0_g1_i1.p1 TRINITY_DN59749_c0_g1~~TRINITY_DN59749_c0_g1_i1.p1  ORF type:complete len:1037 (+),score=228.11 TRINITY_DN59749_c0_g1_i1:43-3153(+)
MDDFEKAVRVVFTQGDPSITADVRQQATQFCDAIKARPDGWRFCWEQFLQRQVLEIKFWCLQVVCQALPPLPLEYRIELRGKVLLWLRDVAPLGKDSPVVRNKVALVYVGLMKQDYPEVWPGGWQELLAMLDKGPAVVDMLLRILATFDDEVTNEEAPRTSEERQRAHKIKHAMRAGDATKLVECWYAILGNFRQTPQLILDCLKVVAVYSVWIDIHTVANVKFLDAVCSLAAEASAQYASEACGCLAAILSKKMPSGQKSRMLLELQVLQRLEAITSAAAGLGNAADEEMLLRQAKLCNGMLEMVLEIYLELRLSKDEEGAKLAGAMWELISVLMPLIFKFFSNQTCQIADAVEPGLTEFFVKVKTFLKSDVPLAKDEQRPNHCVDMDQVRPFLVQSLQLIIQRIAYPEWFQHGDACYEDDDRHVAFLEFRRSLTKMFRRIYLVDNQLGFQFLQASGGQLTQNLATVRPMEAEALLFLLKETSEVIKDFNVHVNSKGPLVGCFVQVLESEALMKAEHWAIQLALLDLYIRYGKVFAAHPEVFRLYGQRVVECFVGAQGIRSKDPRVVSRACAQFPRFVKMAKQQVVAFATHIYDALQDLLVVSYIPSSLLPVSTDGTVPIVLLKGGLRADDQAGLYEAIAGLVAALPPEQMRPALQMLLKGSAANLTELLNMPAERLRGDPGGFARWAASSIQVMGTISKPFSLQHSCTAPDWQEVLTVVSRILERFAGQSHDGAGLWQAALFVCRRMVEVLGENFFQPLDALLPMLFGTISQTDLVEITVFSHHLVNQFGVKMRPLLQKWFPVLFGRPYDVWTQLAEESAQLKREKLQLSSAVLQLLCEVGKKCPTVLLEAMLGVGAASAASGGYNPAVGESLGQKLVTFLLYGLADPREAKAAFMAAATWSALLEAAVALGPSDSQKVAALLPLPQLLRQVLHTASQLDPGDMQTTKMLGETANILRCVTSKRSLAQGDQQQQQAFECLRQALGEAMPGMRPENGLARLLCEALAQDASLKDVRVLLQRCSAESRAAQAAAGR